MYDHTFYGCDPETGRIDYDEMERLAKEVQPKLIICGASSYPRLIDYERVSKIAESVGAYSMCDMGPCGRTCGGQGNPQPHSLYGFRHLIYHEDLLFRKKRYGILQGKIR